MYYDLVPARSKVGEGDGVEQAVEYKGRVWVAALLYLAAIAGAELMTAVAHPIAGVILHIMLVIGLVIHASLTAVPQHRNLYLTLALAPLIRVLSLSVPLVEFSQIYWYAIIAVPLLIAAFTVVAMLRYRLDEVGLTFKRLRLQLLVATSGIPFGVAEYYILRPEPLVAGLSWGMVLLPALILLVGTGFVEEFIFRGVMQRSAGQAMGRWGWVYVAVMFAVLHTGYLLILDIVFVFVVGLFFAWIVIRTRSLLGVTLAHGITNILLYLVIPFVL
ncbi:MAG: CPBP family intramembrane glutamic endopeptidase [Chloroflexota bacterium]|nr:CPBP family intramembrane glutamic endopeptidase [Chloroflexota bacterium]